MFDFLPNYILIACENYITTSANVGCNYQQLLSLVEIGQNVTSLLSQPHFGQVWG
jgi:hypothetical protein